MLVRGWLVCDHPLSQYVTRGRFIEGSHSQIEIHAWLFQKIVGPFGIPLNGTPYAPSYQLSKADVAWGKGSLESENARYQPPELSPSESVLGLCETWYLIDFPPSQDTTVGYFIVCVWGGAYTNQDFCPAITKNARSFRHSFPILECLRRQAINSTLQTWYCLGESFL